MNASERTDRRLNRYNLVFGIIASLLAIGGAVSTVLFAGGEEDRPGDATDGSGDVSETAAADSPSAEPPQITESAGAAPSSTGGYLDLADAVDTAPCIDDYFYGEWTADAIRLADEEYWNGFSCVPYRASEDELPIGHVDFLVPAGVTRVTGTVGIDDRSVDTTMSAEFLVHSVPEGDAPLFSQVLSYGEIAQIDADLTGVQRVRFEVRVRATDYLSADSLDNPATLAWADMKFA